MKILFCSSEAVPFAKTGGLADVIGSLPAALARLGHQVVVCIPWYRGIMPQSQSAGWGVMRRDGVAFYFIRNDYYYGREHIYGCPEYEYPDNLERFSFLSRQALELCKEIRFAPDIVHAHDWQTALVPAYLKTVYRQDAFWKHAKSIFTVHNMAYQGIFSRDVYPIIGLEEKYFSMEYLEFYGSINILKAGLVFADYVTTVSPTYMKQIQTVDYGYGLDGVMRQRRACLHGILNGIDTTVWNPRTDSMVYRNYTAGSVAEKNANKESLRKELGLRKNKRALLVGMVSRLVDQKGLDIVYPALAGILRAHQVVVLGSGDGMHMANLQRLVKKYPGMFFLETAFNESLAHKIYAASDCFLIPSKFEPCGLSQLIAYRYGSIPIASDTGGLRDTVNDVSQGGAGFVLENYSSAAITQAVARAAAAYAKKDAWLRLAAKAMRYDFSWDVSAKHYGALYMRARAQGKK